MKQIIISIILVLYITLNSNAQNNNNYTVTYFKKLDNSMTARIDAPKKDKNGDICAVIKIVTTQTGFNFEGDGAGLFGSEYKTGEYWIWVGYGAKRITIKHPNLGVLRDYVYPISIEKATDYEMVLITGKITNTVVEEIESKWLLLTTKPDNAMIYLDNVFAGIGTSQKKLKPGKYEYRVEAPYYHNLAGIIEIKTENITKNIDLQPAFGFLQINSQPEDGATIMIDGKTINRTTPTKTDTLASGEHTITITKQMFQPSSQKVMIKDNETTPLTLSMLPNFAEVEISTSNDAVIWIDNNEKGTGLWQGRLDAGIYTIEARKDKYISHKKDIEVKAGEKLKIELKPTPRYGKLDIITMPPMAIITINGKNYGTTPNTISDLLIGDYNLNLTKDGLETINKTITINENKTTEVNEKLASATEITISSSPSYADLTVDGKYIGKTPQKVILSYGNHDIKLSNRIRTINKNINIANNGERLFVFEMPETKLISYKKLSIKRIRSIELKAGYDINNDLQFQSTDINKAYNFQFASRIKYSVFMFEVGYIMGKYNNPSLGNNIYSIIHSGFNANICVLPIPFLGKISYRIYPYFGAGIFIGGLNAKDTDNNRISYINTTSPFWKVGFKLYPINKPIFIDCEFQKSTSNIVEKKFSKYIINIGYNFKF